MNAPNGVRHAFTLIELIVIIVIISIIAAVVIVKFTGVDSTGDLLAANELRANLTYIRNMAMSRERAMRVRFSVASNYYDVYAAASNWTGTYLPAKDPATQKDWTNNIGRKFSGAAMAAVNINGGSTLYFSETNGVPFGAGWAPLTNGAITFSSGRTVTVTPETGYVD